MSEYKRLTKKFENGYVWVDCTNCPSDNKCDDITHYCQTTVKERLAELEDKIEQGTLIEFPCKVGDTVYFVDKQNKIIEEFDVSAIEVTLTQYSDGSNNRIEIVEKGTGKRNFDYILFFGWIGNKVFFTREEAEKRLKELQNG